jgi:hypothetical protein
MVNEITWGDEGMRIVKNKGRWRINNPLLPHASKNK